jgi:RNA polymerase sigma factor (sigma-70 family)
MNDTRKLPDHRHFRVLFEVGSLSALSDGELLARFLNVEGDSAELAFAALVERHASVVMRICRAIVRNEHDAEDAFQATFLVLAAKAARLRVHQSLGPWLSAVARRVSRGARAAMLARAARELQAAKTTRKEAASAGEGNDAASILHEEIDRLPEHYRLPLLLCDLESQSHQEAARRLGWPLGTLKSRQARARETLRTRLSRRGLSSVVPASALTSSHALIPNFLIRSTSETAVRLISSELTAQTISTSVGALLTHSLRSMIMARLTLWVGVVTTVSIGVAATVLAQSAPGRAKRPDGSVSASAATAAEAPTPPVFECEIKIWKDGAPVTPPVKVIAIPGTPTQFATSEGTVELRFHPRRELLGRPDATNSSEATVGDFWVRDMVREAAHAHTAEELQLRERVASELAKEGKNAEPLVRMALMQQEYGDQVIKALKKQGAFDMQTEPKRTEPKVSTSADHEARLAEIERKLERILRVLEPSQPKTSETDASPAKK